MLSTTSGFALTLLPHAKALLMQREWLHRLSRATTAEGMIALQVLSSKHAVLGACMLSGSALDGRQATEMLS